MLADCMLTICCLQNSCHCDCRMDSCPPAPAPAASHKSIELIGFGPQCVFGKRLCGFIIATWLTDASVLHFIIINL